MVRDSYYLDKIKPFTRHDYTPVVVEGGGAALPYNAKAPYLIDNLDNPTKLYFLGKDYICDMGLLEFTTQIADCVLFGPVYVPNDHLSTYWGELLNLRDEPSEQYMKLLRLLRAPKQPGNIDLVIGLVYGYAIPEDKEVVEAVS